MNQTRSRRAQISRLIGETIRPNECETIVNVFAAEVRIYEEKGWESPHLRPSRFLIIKKRSADRAHARRMCRLGPSREDAPRDLPTLHHLHIRLHLQSLHLLPRRLQVIAAHVAVPGMFRYVQIRAKSD